MTPFAALGTMRHAATPPNLGCAAAPFAPFFLLLRPSAVVVRTSDCPPTQRPFYDVVHCEAVTTWGETVGSQ
jgi:hypothetical protein